jgi:xylulose-5-phosphate/fructose-6-phosphate phosphoketolase
MRTAMRTDELLRSDEAISAYGPARATVEGTPLSPDELHKSTRIGGPAATCAQCLPRNKRCGVAYVGASEATAARPLGLRRRPGLCLPSLRPADQGTSMRSTWRAGARSAVPGVFGGHTPDLSERRSAGERFFKRFRFPVASAIRHAQTPASTKAASWATASRARLRNGLRQSGPDHLVMVGDSRSEPGPLATSWHSNKFLNPITDGRCCRSCTSMAHQQPDAPRAHQPRRAERVVRRLWVHPLFCGRQ